MSAYVKRRAYDQAPITSDTDEILHEPGAIELSSPVVELALVALASKSADHAVLDLNLGDETSEGVADELIRQRVPFVFAAGYRDGVTIAERFKDVPVVRKPISQDMLSRQLTQVLVDARA